MAIYATVGIVHRQNKSSVEVHARLSINEAGSKDEVKGMVLGELIEKFPPRESWSIGGVDTIEITPAMLKSYGYIKEK